MINSFYFEIHLQVINPKEPSSNNSAITIIITQDSESI